jgi:hypothetical protein
MEVFQNMWFVPIRERGRTQADTELLLTRARNITDVVTISSTVFFLRRSQQVCYNQGILKGEVSLFC